MTPVSLTDPSPWRRALRHLAWAVVAVLGIALAVNLLALPVVHAQARPALRIADQPKVAGTFFDLQLMPSAIQVQEAVVSAQP